MRRDLLAVALILQGFGLIGFIGRFFVIAMVASNNPDVTQEVLIANATALPVIGLLFEPMILMIIFLAAWLFIILGMQAKNAQEKKAAGSTYIKM